MKRLLLVLILTFSFQSLTKADDIRDFEIEGMSIGDSLLDYFTKDEIENNITHYKSKEFKTANVKKVKEKYNFFRVSYKEGDQNYLIHGVSAIILYKKNIDGCLKKIEEITTEASTVFDNTKYNRSTWSPQFDMKGTINSYEFKLGKGSLSIACLDYSVEMENKKNKIDNLRISLMTKEYIDFLRNKAY